MQRFSVNTPMRGLQFVLWAGVLAALSLGAPRASAQVPTNDNFAAAIVLTGNFGSVTGSTVNATSETGEPVHVGSSQGNSIWYTWTAPADGVVFFNTFGSDFDTLLAIYSGTTLTSLQNLGGNDDFDPNIIGPSGVRFFARVGQTYMIAVDGFAGDTGSVTLTYAYSGAGIFQFTADTYNCTELESTTPNLDVPLARSSLLGVRLTVTRIGGSAGRVLVDYETADGTALAGTDFTAQLGTLTFNDHEMSKSILVPVTYNFLGVEDTDFTVTLSNPRLDPAEDQNIIPPSLNPTLSEATVNIFNVDPDPEIHGVPATNSVFSFQRANYRVREDEVGPGQTFDVDLYVYRTGSGDSLSIQYKILTTPLTPGGDNRRNNAFALDAGSDYATPLPLDAIPFGSSADFYGNVGTLQWGQDDFQPKALTLTITNDSLVEFNEDILIQLIIQPTQNDKRFLSSATDTILTILHDDLPAGSVDPNHNPDYNLGTIPPNNPNPGANGIVYSALVLPSGATLIGGSFTAVNTISRNRIARLNADGSHDGSFNPGTGANDFVSSMALDSTGRIFVGGGFTSFNGSQRNGIARLTSTGSLDAAFNPGQGANGTVWTLAVQGDGKVLIGGEFTTVGTEARNYIARLNVDGTLDTTFNPGVGPNGFINAILVQADGAIVIGGEFSSVSGVARSGIARLNANGTLDGTFNPGAGADGAVYALALQGAKILVGGAFSNFDLRSSRRLARLEADGTFDTTFNIGTGADDTVYAITVQNNGLIYVGGIFTSFNQTRRVGLARLESYGTVDTTFLDTAYNDYAGVINRFESDPKNFVFSISLDLNNDVMIGGGFKYVGGGRYNPTIQPEGHDFGVYTRAAYRVRNNIARLLGGATPGPGAIELAYDNYTIDENSSQLYVSIMRTNGSLGPISANFSVAQLPPGPGAATNGVDYAANGASPQFSTSWGSTRMRSDGIYGPNFDTVTVIPNFFVNSVLDDVHVDIFDNTVQDGDRTATLELSTPSDSDIFFLGGENISVGAAIGRASAPMVIADNDTLHGVLGFSTPTYFVNENGTNALITVTRTNGSSGNVTVQFQTSPGTAIAGTDYTSTNGTLTFLNNQTSKSFLVRITDESTVEPDETINITLFNATGLATLGLTNSTLSIVDNDYPGGKLSFVSATYTTNESAVSAIVSVKRAGSGAGSLTVYATATNGASGTAAISDTDFVGVTNLLSWANGDTSTKTFVVPLLDDNVIEDDETVTLRLVSPKLNGVTNLLSIGAVSNATLTLLNDDLSGIVSFSTATYIANENSGTANITVVRTGGSSDSISVNYAALSATAIDGVDFSAVSGTLSFGPGEVSKSFTVPIIDNLDVNADRFITLALSDATPPSALGSSAAIINLVDDESFNEPPGGVDTEFSPLGANDAVASLAIQGDGKILASGNFTAVGGLSRNRVARLSSGGQVDVTFSSTAVDAGADSTVHSVVAQTDGRVVIGGEFANVAGSPRSRFARLNFNGTLDGGFDPGAGTDNPVFAVAEGFLGGARKIFIGGSFANYAGTPRNGIARINNDGTLDTAFSPGTGADGIVYAVATYPASSTLSGKVLIGGEFTSVNGVPRAGVARLNSDGSVDLSFDPGSGANGAVRALVIQTDERILVGGSFTDYDGTAANRIVRLIGDGSVDGTFNTGVGADDTVLSIAVQGDTRILLGGLFTHCNGVSRSRITRLNNDGSVDPSINFGAGANSYVSSIVVQPDGKIVIGGGFTEYDGVPRQHIARIYGGSISGSGTLEFMSPNYQVFENLTNATLVVRRFGGTAGLTPGGSVTVDATTIDVTATNGIHYTGGTTTLTFAEGEVFATLSVQVIDDFEVNDDRTLDVELSNITPLGSAAIGNQPTAQLTIVNEDSAISFANTTFNGIENAIDGQAVITIARSGAVSSNASVIFSTTTNGTATVGTDYTATTVQVDFAIGETSKTVSVPILNDGLIEGIETVSMELTNALGAFLLTPSVATLSITDDDLGPGQIAFAAATYSVAENSANAAISLVRTNGKTGVVSVKIQTADVTATAGADYIAQNNVSVTFGDGETNKIVLIPMLDDSFVEGDEVFNLSLTNATGGATIVGASTVPVTITENDEAFSLSSPIYVFGEEGPALTVTVLRIGGSNGVVSVRYDTVGSAQSTNFTAAAGVDFTGITNGLLSFANGEVSKTFTVPVTEDALVEGDETFGITLSNPTPGIQLLTSSATVSILDNDTGFSLSAAAYTVDEGTNLLVTVYRTNANTGPASVSIATTNLSATAGTDYSSTGGSLNFTNGEAVKTVLIPIVNDLIVEGDETFLIELSSPSLGAQIVGVTAATNTIIDNDASLRFSSASYAVNENGVQATITVVREAVTTNTVAVNYATSDGTATAVADYSTTSGLLVFTNGEVSKTFSVLMTDDTLEEGPETILLSLSSPTGQVQLVSASAAILTIVDNDGGSILPAGSLIQSESIVPANSAIDPGETVTVLFALRNASGVNTTNLIATLLTTNGVTAPSAAQSYGALENEGASVSRPFTFTASGTNGGSISATFSVAEQSGQSYGRVTFSYVLGTTTTVFSNTAAITITDNAIASPYPSSINVTGLVGTVSKVVATVTNLYHPSPDDIDMLLAGPTGTNTMLMSDSGGGNLITNVTLTFDDSASTFLPDTTVISSGTNKPTNFLIADLLPAPAPAGPWGSTLAAFNGTNPNGLWSLYIKDDLTIFSGAVQRGWQIAVTTRGTLVANTDLSVKSTATPSPVVAGSNLTYTITVTNHGPYSATGVKLTNTIPSGATFVSATISRGTYSTNSGAFAWNITTNGTDSVLKDGYATATIVVLPGVAGAAVSIATVSGNESDPNPLNNVATNTVTVASPSADISVSVIDLPDPVLVAVNSTLTYSISITNAGPATASQVSLTNTLPPGVAFLSATPAGYTVSGDVVTFANLGNLGAGATPLVATITVTPLVSGQLTNTTVVASAVIDPLKGNNTASVKTIVSGMGFVRSGNALLISWPSDATGYMLQYADSLTPPINWQTVSSVPTEVSGMNYVTNTIGAGNRFFRLTK